MNNLQIADLITSECKKRSIKTALLLQECGINHSFISDIRHKNRAPSVDKISVIADYLGVSVDYLLGRTDKPEGMTGDVGNNLGVNISKTACDCNDELVSLISSLSLLERSKVVLFIDSLRQNENKG